MHYITFSPVRIVVKAVKMALIMTDHLFLLFIVLFLYNVEVTIHAQERGTKYKQLGNKNEHR